MARRNELDTKILDGIIKNLDGNRDKAVAKVAFAVEGRAKVAIQQMQAIDTGAMLNSVYTSLAGDTSRFNKAKSEAISASRKRNKRGQVKPLTSDDFVELPNPKNGAVAYVGPSVDYGEEVHSGTHNMAGRPYLLQAIRETATDMKREMGKAVSNGK